MDILDSLHKEGCTICMVTHDLELAKRVERNIHILDGEFVEGLPHIEEAYQETGVIGVAKWT